MRSCNTGVFLMISIVFVPLTLSSCATAWKSAGSYYRSTTTDVSFTSDLPGKVYVNNRYIGEMPIVHPVHYEKQVAKHTRKVSYWITQPGWSALLSIVSLGLYIPFSLIPVDTETVFTPTHEFRNNEFDLMVVSEGYTTWQKKITCEGGTEYPVKVIPEKNEADAKHRY